MDYLTITSGTGSSRVYLGKSTCASMKCEIGKSSEYVIVESLGCNAIADKSVIFSLLRGHLLSQFGKSSVNRKATTVEKQITRRILDTEKLLIEN